jgi:serpin B
MLTLTLALVALQESPAAEPLPDAAPLVTAHERIVARAMTDFGFDLHRALASQAPNADSFVAPYSLARSFAILAEGARGETAREFHAALRWPAEALVETASGPRFRPEVVHAGLAAFARRVEFVDVEKEADLRQRIEEVRAEYESLFLHDRELRDGRGRRSVRRVERVVEDLDRDEMEALLAEADRRRAEGTRLAREFWHLVGLLPGHDLSTQRALWIESSWALVPTHTALLEEFHGPQQIRSVPFATDPSAARAALEAWCLEFARRPLGDLVPLSTFDESTRLVQIDTLDLVAGWAHEFDEYWTEAAEFTATDGTRASVELMSTWFEDDVRYGGFERDGSLFETPIDYEVGTEPNGYPSEGGFQVVELPYRGDTLSFLLFLPIDTNGLSALEGRITSTELGRIVAALVERTTDVELPRFEISKTTELSSALDRLGVQRAFIDPTSEGGGADFSGCVQDRPEGLVLDAITHRAGIRVDEKGTVVEVATIVGRRYGGREYQPRIPFVPVVRADHPFLFVVIDRATNAVLFVGRKAHG